MAVYGNELYHYGIPRKSGRYPYGSGKEPYQDDPKKRRLNKDESAPKATSKRPETIWEKHRKAQAAKKAQKDREAKKVEATKAAEKQQKIEDAKPASQKAKEMSDEELMRAINRLRLEQTYLSMLNPSKSNQNNQQSSSNQEAVKKGKKFMEKLNSSTKSMADLSQNIGNIASGAQKTYANIQSIKKLMRIAEEEARKKG